MATVTVRIRPVSPPMPIAMPMAQHGDAEPAQAVAEPIRPDEPGQLATAVPHLSGDAFKAECNRRRRAGLILAGNTWPIREQIKAAGGIWDARGKFWLMPTLEVLAALRAQITTETARAAADPTQRRSKSWRRGHWVEK